jgi:hypothetical protein
MDRTEIIQNYLEKNPDVSFKEFKKDMPKVKVTGQYFYYLRKKFRGSDSGRKRGITRSSVFLTLFTKDATNTSQEAKDLLQEFLTVLNQKRKARLELVEYVNHTIEIREAQ